MGNRISLPKSIQSSSINNKNTIRRNIVLIGNFGEGKSSLFERFAEDTFTYNPAFTIPLDFKIKHISIDDIEYKLVIWDTNGMEKIVALRKTYLNNMHGVIVVSDITNPKSLEQVLFWVNITKTNSNLDNLHIIWTGSKCDLENERKTSLDDIYKFAEDNNLQYMKTSAKDNINVDLLFEILLRQIENLPTPNPYRIKSARK